MALFTELRRRNVFKVALLYAIASWLVVWIVAAVQARFTLPIWTETFVLFILAVMDFKNGRQTWFQRHRTGTWIFVFFWMVSVVSGETIFFLQFGDRLFA